MRMCVRRSWKIERKKRRRPFSHEDRVQEARESTNWLSPGVFCFVDGIGHRMLGGVGSVGDVRDHVFGSEDRVRASIFGGVGGRRRRLVHAVDRAGFVDLGFCDPGIALFFHVTHSILQQITNLRHLRQAWLAGHAEIIIALSPRHFQPGRAPFIEERCTRFCKRCETSSTRARTWDR
jgi:hypothetical protein